MGVRKNAAKLSTTERDNFINALLELKRTGIYDQFVAIHEGVTTLEEKSTGDPMYDGAHGNAAFFPWHREFLIRFEKALNATNPNTEITIPYWKWDSGDSVDTTRIFVDDFIGPAGTGNKLVGEITTGYFTKTKWKVHDSLHGGIPGTVLRRRTSLDPNSTEWPTLPRFVANHDKYTDLRIAFEKDHGEVHGWVGYNNGSMWAMTSPNDPIFYLHHTNIDRVWAKWQETHRGAAFYNPRPVPQPNDDIVVPYGHKIDDKMWPWDAGNARTPLPHLANLLPTFQLTDVKTPRDVLEITFNPNHPDHYSYS